MFWFVSGVLWRLYALRCDPFKQAKILLRPEGVSPPSLISLSKHSLNKHLFHGGKKRETYRETHRETYREMYRETKRMP